MNIFSHYGRTVATDLVLSIDWRHGAYFAIGRLDGGINWNPSFWRTRRLPGQIIIGPVDFMWTRKKQ